jgi:hypothetical protein
MKDKKITPESEAEFVKTLMDTDLNLRHRPWTDEQKLKYLSIVGHYVDELGEKILANPSPEPEIVGENRLENTPFDVAIIATDSNKLNPQLSPLIGLISDAMERDRPDGETCLNPIQWLSSAKCLIDNEAVEWLYGRKYTHEYSHIHVFPFEMCLLMPSDHDDSDFAWIESDGVQVEGSFSKVMDAMYTEYTRRHANEVG